MDNRIPTENAHLSPFTTPASVNTRLPVNRPDVRVDISPLQRRRTVLPTTNNIVRDMFKNRTFRQETSTSPSRSSQISIPNQQTSIIGILCDPLLWTDEIEQQFLEFSTLCKYSASRCKSSAIWNNKISTIIQISLILMGSLTFSTAIGPFNELTKQIVSTICGISIAALTSIQSFLSLGKKSEVQSQVTYELERMARAIKLELSKKKESRSDPFDEIIKLENQREKLLKRVGIEED